METTEMASSDSSSRTAVTETVGSTQDDVTLSPLTSSQNSEEGRRTEGADASGISDGDGQKPAASGVGGFASEIQTLKMRLNELERQAQNNLAVAKEEETRPQPMEDLEEYRRMEACLKNHRKEWEREIGPGDWGIKDRGPRNYMEYGQGSHDLFYLNWDFWKTHQYQPPSLFKLSRKVADGQEQSGADTYDEFDQTIDYGNRRDRLRKNFEWEMDRIYLVEEMDRRRREKIKAAKEGNLSVAARAEDAGPEPPKFAQPQLNRVDWTAFRTLSTVQEKDAFVIDILMGEPNVHVDFSDNGHWYGFPGQVHKRAITLDVKDSASMLPGQAQLPERVRIHSKALARILSIILRKEMGGTTVVFIRPFKALAYCEPALRGWCAALEKMFEAAPEANKGVAAPTDGSAAGSQKEDADPQEPGKGPSNVPADGSDTLEEPAPVGEEPPKKRGSKDEDGQAEDKLDDITKSPTALEHLKCLLSFVDSDISAKQAYVNSPDCRKIFFSDLWYLFRPGVEVTVSGGKQAYRVIDVTSAKHRVALPWERWSNTTGKHNTAPPFSITCIYIDFDGKNLGPVLKYFDFKRFDGERDVTSLEAYPLRFHPVKRDEFSASEWKELEALPANERYRQKLIRRGAKFLEVAGVKHMYYAGPTLEARDEVESQVVIDFETAFSVEDQDQRMWMSELKNVIEDLEIGDGEPDVQDEACSAACCRLDNVHDDSYVDRRQGGLYLNGLLPKASAVNEQPSIAIVPRLLKELRTSSGSSLVSDDELVIMSYRVFGFVLRSRKWAKLDLSHLTDVHLPETERDTDGQGGIQEKERTTAFDRLVLEEGHRPTILALIAQHFRDKKSTGGQKEEFDIVRGKGKGLILLLHGAPGVGKTSTAEGVAELFKKPLFQITCGDLGTTVEEVEVALETNFTLASRWDCILLLDEADVFLAERTKQDFKRNGLVAVFLRVIEYYTGILFLTTNRIGDFDEAFASRIHVSLYYPDLNSEKTVKVFKLNMHMIRERFAQKGRKIEIDEMGIGGFATQHFTANPQARWNGRQIRNACQTALALAEFEAQGNSHQEILRPDAVVTLGVKQFEIVRNAYLEFSKYMNTLYGSNSARRAKEAKVRAIWGDENNNVVADLGAAGLGGTAMHKTGLGAASGIQPRPPPRQWHHQAPPTQEQRYSYQDVAVTHPGYADASHRPLAQADQFPSGGQSWGNPGERTANVSASISVNANAPYEGFREGQNNSLALRQPSPAEGQHYDPSPPQQKPAYSPGFDRDIQAMYTASRPHAAGQLPSSDPGPSSGSAHVPRVAAPGQQW